MLIGLRPCGALDALASPKSVSGVAAFWDWKPTGDDGKIMM